jgi:hypothetical protein
MTDRRQPPQSGGCASQKNCFILEKKKRARAKSKNERQFFYSALRAFGAGGGIILGRLGIPPRAPLAEPSLLKYPVILRFLDI